MANRPGQNRSEMTARAGHKRMTQGIGPQVSRPLLEDRFKAPNAEHQSASARNLTVAHSPQVAARAAHHWHVSKAIQAGETRTLLSKLDTPGRQEEIARMLSGANVTQEARNAAKSLLESALLASAPVPAVKRGRRS